MYRFLVMGAISFHNKTFVDTSMEGSYWKSPLVLHNGLQYNKYIWLYLQKYDFLPSFNENGGRGVCTSVNKSVFAVRTLTLHNFR